MDDSDCEIECLDEDAEIVEQCIRSSSAPDASKHTRYRPQPRPRLLVERPTPQRRKRKVQEHDSEYEPSDDNEPASPPSSPHSKKKPKLQLVKKPRNTFHPNISAKIIKRNQSHAPTVHENFLMRKNYDIRIPDYEDPLCLPVRAYKSNVIDFKRLSNWNNACLEHFKHCDTLLKPEQGVIKTSIRTAVFRNVINKNTGQAETSIWSKTCVENEDADKKSEIFQSVLPRYREKKSPSNYFLAVKRDRLARKTVSEVVLTKEMHKDGEALVVYKPKEGISAVYGMIDNREKTEDGTPAPNTEDSKLYLKELTACRMCAPCFQVSWRGVTKSKEKSVLCPICGRSCVTAYNLLSHFKSHDSADVSRCKHLISGQLAGLVEYHYRCRMCRNKFNSIRALRAHVKDHQSKEKFTCVLCKKIVNGR